MPTKQAVIMEAIAPPKRARIPREATSDLRSGAKPPMQPTLIPTEEKLANPQRAKVAMSLPLSLSSWSWAGTPPIDMCFKSSE